MRVLLFITTLALIATNGYGQPIEKIYYDSAWRIITDTTDVQYYRVNRKESDLFHVTYYYKSHALYMDGTCSSVSPKNVWVGPRISYYENGKKSFSGVFVNNVPVGYDTSFYEDGKMKTLRLNSISEDDPVRYYQHWTTQGVPVLKAGAGSIIEFSEDLKTQQVSIIADSLMEAHFSVSSDQDTVFTLTEKTAEYKGGMANFYKTIKVDYPKSAIRLEIQGTVYISFIIRKDGTTSDINIMKGIGGGCNEAALEAFRRQRNWLPGQYKGKPVSQKMVLPIAFRLE